MSRKPVSKAELSRWLLDQTPEHLEFLRKMRVRLGEHMDALPDRAVPDRDFARVAQVYFAGWHAVVADVRETAKMALLAAKTGHAVLTDEDFDREMRMLGLDAVKQLDTADLAAELAARGLTMPAVSDDEQ